MKTIIERIEYVRAQPREVRQRIASGTAAVLTAFIALVWLAGGVVGGAFAVSGNSFADAKQGDTKASVTGSGAGSTSGLAGVAAAGRSDDTTARITIIDSATTTSARAEQTVVPF